MEEKYEMYAASKNAHEERIEKNPGRIDYAIKQFNDHGIKYELKNEETCHFHTWRKADGQLFQFWASTGKILGSEKRGIEHLIEMLD